MLARKDGTLISLHEAARGMGVLVIGSADADVASGLFHDDTEDDALFNTDFGGLEDGVVYGANVLAAIACLENLGLVDVEEHNEVFPRLLAGE
jgi:hypothetical protein